MKKPLNKSDLEKSIVFSHENFPPGEPPKPLLQRGSAISANVGQDKVGNHDPFLRRISFEKKKKSLDRKKVTALSSLNQFEHFLFVQVLIDHVYHLSYHNKLRKTFSFRVIYSNSVLVYEIPQKKGGEKRITKTETAFSLVAPF